MNIKSLLTLLEPWPLFQVVFIIFWSFYFIFSKAKTTEKHKKVLAKKVAKLMKTCKKSSSVTFYYGEFW